MEKSEIINENSELLNKLKEKFNNHGIVKINSFFHLNEKEIYSYHKEYICTYIVENIISSNFFFALKNASTGEGYIYDGQNNIYIKSHSQMISKLIINQKNNYIISCSYDKTIIIWDLIKLNNNSSKLAELKGHKGRIYDMDLIIDKDELLSCGMDKNILLWDIKNFNLIKKIYLNTCIHNLVVKYLFLEKNIKNVESEELIFVYTQNKGVNFIDLNNGEIIDKFNIYCNDGSILILNNEEYVYQNKKTFNIIIFNFILKKLSGTMTGCKNDVVIILKFSKANKIISYDKGNNIKIWNYLKKFCEFTIKIDFVLYCLYIDSNGNLFCGSNKNIYIYK